MDETRPPEAEPENQNAVGDEDAQVSHEEAAASRKTEALEKGRALGRQALEQTREAAENARSAVLALLTDPMGGQRQAWHELGPHRALSAGIFLLVASALGIWLGGRMFFGSMPVDGGVLRLFWTACVAAGSYVLAVWGVGRAFGGHAGLTASVFSAGVALAPGAASAVTSALLIRLSLPTLAQACMVFGMAIAVLLINAAMLDLHGLNTRRAVIATPATLVATFALTRAFLAIL